jgi:hypothetical protein
MPRMSRIRQIEWEQSRVGERELEVGESLIVVEFVVGQ